MQIIDHSYPEEVNERLYQLASEVGSMIYPVGLHLQAFRYEGNDGFSLTNMKEIYPDDQEHIPFSAYPSDFSFPEEVLNPIEGRIQRVSFAYVKDMIKLCLSLYFSYEFVMEVIADDLIAQRVECYWNFVSSFIIIPPSFCFEHIPVTGSLFDINGARWKFCFILLDAEYKRGVIISGFGIK